MRVIHILDHSIPVRTAYAARTIAMLAQQRSLGWETFHLTGTHHDAGGLAEEDVDGWHFYRTPPAGGILEGLPALGTMESIGEVTYRIERIAGRVHPHILHAHAPALNAIPALRVGRRLGIPVVYELHPLDETTGGASRTGWLARRFRRDLETWVLKRADAVTTMDESMWREIVLRGIPVDKVTMVPPGIGSRETHFKDQRPAAPYGGQCDNERIAGAAVYRELYAHLMGVTSLP